MPRVARVFCVVVVLAASGAGAGLRRAWAEPPARLRTVEVLGEPDDADDDGDERGAARPSEPAAGSPSAFSTQIPVTQRAGVANPAQLAAEAPGTQLRDLGGPGQRQELVLRGASNAQLVVFLDGIRLSPPQGGGFDLQLVSADHLDRIEVLRGADSARFGSDALGGVVNLVTRELSPGAEPRTLISLGYGSFETLRLHVDRSARAGDWAYLVSLSHAQSRGDFPYVDDNNRLRVRDNDDSHAESVLAKVSRRALGGELTLLADGLWDVRGVPGSAEFPSTTARQEDIRTLVAAREIWDDVGARGGRLKLTLFSRVERLIFLDGSPPFGAPLDSRSVAVVPGGDVRYELAVGRHALVEAGVEGRAEKLVDAQAGDPLRGAVDVFAVAELFTAERRLVLAPAFRLATLASSGPIGTDWDHTAIPALGLALAPFLGTALSRLGPLSLRANVGRAYRNPSLYELYVVLGGLRGNPNLKPEDALSWDAGLRWQTRRLLMEVVYFDRRVSRSILFLPTSTFEIVAQNFRDLAVHGVESALSFGPIGPFKLDARYTFQDARFDEAPRWVVPGRPRHVGGGGISLSTRLGDRDAVRHGEGPPMRLRVRTFVDAQSAFFLDRFNALREEARAMWGAAVSLERGRVRIVLEGRNLLDKRNAVDALQLPLAPRTVFASLEMRP